MKDRLVTFAAAAAALLLTMMLLLPRSSEDEQISLPNSEDAGKNGLLGLKTWLEGGGVPVFSLRKRYSALLKNEKLVPTGNVLILSLPHSRENLQSEWRSLSTWLAGGNTALILGHVYKPARWKDTENCLCDAVKLLKDLGWELKSSRSKRDKTSHKNQASLNERIGKLKADVHAMTLTAFEIMPLSTLPSMAALNELESEMAPFLLEKRWQLSTDSDQLGLRLFALATDKDKEIIWQIQTGLGQIVLSLAGDLFSNTMLNRADNAVWMKNLLAQVLSEDGQVIFDDYHFGLSDLYDPEQFFSDVRLHQTLGLIVLFWFLYVISYSNRLAPVRPATIKVSVLDSVEAMAGFFAGHLKKKQLARELTRQLLQDIRLTRHLKDEADVWRWLEGHPQIATSQITMLRQAMQLHCPELNVLTDTLSEIRSKTVL